MDQVEWCIQWASDVTHSGLAAEQWAPPGSRQSVSVLHVQHQNQMLTR